MIDRRDFLGGVLALGAIESPPRVAAGDAARREYLADLAGCDLRELGVPRGRSPAEDGLHPVTPGRVVVVDDARLAEWGRLYRGPNRRFREDEDRLRGKFPSEPLPRRKVDLAIGLMDRLSGHYRRPDLFPMWSRPLLRRELLASTGIGYGFGLLHDFQSHDTPVHTDNAVVDWWLVLVPGGVDWGSFDDRPVYYMVGPVMERRKPGDYLRVMCALSRALRLLVRAEDFDPAAWAGRLARMDPADAAREFNATACRGLTADRESRGRAGRR